VRGEDFLGRLGIDLSSLCGFYLCRIFLLVIFDI
jgi:hypothetical protein